MKNTISFLLFFVALAFPTSMRTWAHPHVFLENKVTFIFKTKGLAGINIRWTFDKFMSRSIILDFDQNRDQKLSPREIGRVREKMFKNLANFNFFIQAEVDNKKKSIKEVQKFRASIEHRQVVYTFFAPLDVSCSSTNDVSVKIAFRDESNFTSITTKKEHVTYLLDHHEALKKAAFKDVDGFVPWGEVQFILNCKKGT